MSTPQSENVQIGPKVSIFCVVTIIFQHCLNPLGHGVHQSFTGCHWSPLPLLHDDIPSRLRREGIMLCFSMSQYMLAFMVPSMNCSSPVPAALMHPQTMTLPPPYLTVGKTHLSLYSSPGCHHTLDTILTKYFYLGLIRPQGMVPVILVLSLIVFSKLFVFVLLTWLPPHTLDTI